MNSNHNKLILVINSRFNNEIINIEKLASFVNTHIIEKKDCADFSYYEKIVKKQNDFIKLIYDNYIANPFAYYCAINEDENIIEIKYIDEDETGHESWIKKFVWKNEEWISDEWMK